MRRFPHSASQDVRDAFTELDDSLRAAAERLRLLERVVRESGISEQELDEVKVNVAKAARPKPPEWDDVFRASGALHSIGHVPDPGAAAGTDKFLREDATWSNSVGGVWTLQQLNFNDIAAPGLSAADYAKLYMDQTAEKLKISEDGGAFTDVVPLGAYYASFIDPNGTGTKGSWDGYIRTGMKFPFSATITAVWVQVIGGTNAVVNLYLNGTWYRTGHQTVSPTSYTLITPVNHGEITAVDAVFPYISSLSGAVTQVAFGIIFKRP